MYIIYLIKAELEENIYYKIGITKRTVSERIKDFKTGNISNFSVVKTFTTKKYPFSIEKQLHRYFNTKKIKGEWFDLQQSDIEIFTELCQKYYDNYQLIENSNTYYQESKNNFK
jgi:hypothetical protein